MSTPQQQLDEALAVRHQLMLGKATQSLSIGERRVEYTKTDLKTLDAYIAELRRQINGASASCGRSRIRYVVPG